MELFTELTNPLTWLKVGSLFFAAIIMGWAAHRTLVTLISYAWEGKTPKLREVFRAAWPAAGGALLMYAVFASYSPGGRLAGPNPGKAEATKEQKKKEAPEPPKKRDKEYYEKQGIYITPDMEEYLDKGCTFDELEYGFHGVVEWTCPQ